MFRLGGRYTLGIIKRRRQDICQPFNILWENEEDNITGDYLHQANLHTPRLVHGCGVIPSLLLYSNLAYDCNIYNRAYQFILSVARQPFVHLQNTFSGQNDH